MYGYAYLIAALVVGVVGIGFYKSGPLLERWSARLKRDVERMRQGPQ